MNTKDYFRLRFDKPTMSAGGEEAEMQLYGEIIADMPEAFKWSKEDKSAADFDKAIKALKEGGTKRLTLRINSPGGVVTEAMAMRSTLNNAKFENLTIRIEGLCASAATIIATIPSANVEIAPGSEYMIHNPWTWTMGNAEELERTAEHLRNEEKTVRTLYAKKTNQTDEQIKEWMDKETWFTAEEAVKYGFCDTLVKETEKEGKAVACVTQNTMRVMQGMYLSIPDTLTVQEEEMHDKVASPTTSAVAAGGVTENTTPKEENEMDIKDLTLEQLQAENPELANSIMKAGAEQERQRLQDIDDLTPNGYEEMARDAKQSGMTAMDFHKAIIKAQREKGQKFLEARKEETAPAANVRGEASEDKANANEDMDAFAKEMANFAKAARQGIDGGMY